MTDDEKKGFFARGPAGRRKIKKINSKPRRIGTDGEEISVNGLGRLYNKIVAFSVITRYFVYVLPIAILIAAPIVIYAVLNPHALLGTTGIRVYIFFTWIEIIWLSIWVSKLVAKAIPYVFMFLCGVVSSGTRKYALVLKAVEIPLSLVGWAVTCLVTFTALMEPGLNTGRGTASKHWVSVHRVGQRVDLLAHSRLGIQRAGHSAVEPVEDCGGGDQRDRHVRLTLQREPDRGQPGADRQHAHRAGQDAQVDHSPAARPSNQRHSSSSLRASSPASGRCPHCIVVGAVITAAAPTPSRRPPRVGRC